MPDIEMHVSRRSKEQEPYEIAYHFEHVQIFLVCLLSSHDFKDDVLPGDFLWAKLLNQVRRNRTGPSFRRCLLLEAEEDSAVRTISIIFRSSTSVVLDGASERADCFLCRPN